MTKLIFKQKEGFTNTYITDTLGDELGHINNESYNSNNSAQYSAEELYEIADKMTGNPSHGELFEAHNQLIDKAKQLRKRVSQLMDELDKDASALSKNHTKHVPGKINVRTN